MNSKKKSGPKFVKLKKLKNQRPSKLTKTPKTVVCPLSREELIHYGCGHLLYESTTGESEQEEIEEKPPKKSSKKTVTSRKKVRFHIYIGSPFLFT